MKQIRPMIYLVAFLLVFSACNSTQTLPAETESKQKPLVVFLVRHAEKVDASKDPELSEAGKMRAAALAHVLKSSQIEHVYSSDYIRTRNTAAPIASELGLEVETYDPRKLEEFAEQLKEMGGRHLVVGHSNTTPQMATLLGGEAGKPIEEANEYDRLYVVSIADNGQVSTVLMRYGE